MVGYTYLLPYMEVPPPINSMCNTPLVGHQAEMCFEEIHTWFYQRTLAGVPLREISEGFYFTFFFVVQDGDWLVVGDLGSI